MKPKYNAKNSKPLTEIWREFIQSELKTGSKLGKVFEKAGFGGYNNKVLTLYFEDEGLSKTARGQSEPLKKKLPSLLKPCDRVEFRLGSVPEATPKPVDGLRNQPQKGKMGRLGNPLQALNFAEFGYDRKGEELSQPVLEAAVQAEQTCDSLYTRLRQRTEDLVGDEGVTLTVDFSWRLRVGGTRGFRELLLPVFHPVFGIPYIPAASLKGAARAWAREHGESNEIEHVLGMLKGKTAKAAKVEFLDAFPTQHCLSVDVATPQWHWKSGKVAYQPEPHPLLSLEQPQFLIGLRPTSPENAHYVPLVRDWLENALKTGIGSRVSGGYGRALGQAAALPYSQSFNFELWTQGMFGSKPPTKQNHWQGEPEFRPTAIRGILRYWFRAAALVFYDAGTCQTLENTLFGALGEQGNLAISVLFNPSSRTDPYVYAGRIYLEATEQRYLTLLSQILVLASHLGGVGRGSRRPLHLLNGRMRGCHWIVDNVNLPLEYNIEQWQQFFENLQTAFQAVQSPTGNHISSPGEPNRRQQDALDKNAQVWLLKSTEQIAPKQVKNWQVEGNEPSVLGSALSLLYGNLRFKGENQQGQGNKDVGGSLGTPSFVWIKSIFPVNNSPYQVVTIFGVDHPDRLAFAQALQRSGAMLVFGQMPSGGTRSNIPRRLRS